MKLPCNETYYLLEGWEMKGTGLIWALCCTLIVTLIYESLRSYMDHVENVSITRSLTRGRNYPAAFRHCLLAFLYVFRVYTSYLLLYTSMLNVWILLTFTFSSGVGYLLIRPLTLYFLDRRGKHIIGDIEQSFFARTLPLCSTPNKDLEDQPNNWWSLKKQDQVHTHHLSWIHSLRERKRSCSKSSSTLESLENALQWDYDQNFNLTSYSEANNWVKQAMWDGSLEMLEAGYVGCESPEKSQLLTMYVSVV